MAVVLGVVALAAACGEDPPKFTAPVTLGGTEVAAEVLNAGHRSYEMRCASCHGPDGSGQGPAATGLAKRPRDFRQADYAYKSTGEGELPTDEDIDATIRNGKPKNGMPAFGGLADADRHAIIQYLKTFSPRWTAAPAEAS
ncbi:MAG: c-type cytochrome [Nannocystaceae bacterium]|nr:cytochrome c [bacterium]